MKKAHVAIGLVISLSHCVTALGSQNPPVGESARTVSETNDVCAALRNHEEQEDSGNIAGNSLQLVASCKGTSGPAASACLATYKSNYQNADVVVFYLSSGDSGSVEMITDSVSGSVSLRSRSISASYQDISSGFTNKSGEDGGYKQILNYDKLTGKLEYKYYSTSCGSSLCAILPGAWKMDVDAGYDCQPVN